MHPPLPQRHPAYTSAALSESLLQEHVIHFMSFETPLGCRLIIMLATGGSVFPGRQRRLTPLRRLTQLRRPVGPISLLHSSPVLSLHQVRFSTRR